LRALVLRADVVFRVLVLRAVVLRAELVLRAVVFFLDEAVFRDVEVFRLVAFFRDELPPDRDDDPPERDEDEREDDERDEEDDPPEDEPDFVSPFCARVLLTVRAAISFARFVDLPCFFSESLTCSYCRSRFELHASGMRDPPCEFPGW